MARAPPRLAGSIACTATPTPANDGHDLTPPDHRIDIPDEEAVCRIARSNSFMKTLRSPLRTVFVTACGMGMGMGVGVYARNGGTEKERSCTTTDEEGQKWRTGLGPVSCVSAREWAGRRRLAYRGRLALPSPSSRPPLPPPSSSSG